MSPSLARSQLLQTSAILEAIRPQATSAVTSGKSEDEPIRLAWAKALDAYRKACADFASAS